MNAPTKFPWGLILIFVALWISVLFISSKVGEMQLKIADLTHRLEQLEAR